MNPRYGGPAWADCFQLSSSCFITLSRPRARTEGRESFHVSRTFDGTSVSYPGLPSGFIAVHWGDVTLLADRGLLHVTGQGEQQFAFDIAPEAREELEAAMSLDLHAAHFHIEVLLADGKTRDFETDLSESQARAVGRKYAAGAMFLVNGRRLVPADIQRLRISATARPASVVRAEIEAEPKRPDVLRVQRNWRLNVVERGQDVTRSFLERGGLADIAGGTTHEPRRREERLRRARQKREGEASHVRLPEGAEARST